mgnify:FL=1|tara:strand:- start:2565 stop:3011 length:447 start_codon:yes stop_codon:yes gene_type:complete
MYQPSYADIKSCIEIEEDAKRLNCYDSFFINKDNIDEANEDIIEKKEKVAEVSIQEYEQENFGLPSKLRQAEDADELKIVSRIDSVSQRLNLQLIIILENGQIWQSVEKIRDIRLRDGYDVEIKEGFLSGYTLRVPGKKIKLRVRRQK